MTLSEFFSKEHGSQSRMAKTMGIPAPMLSQWASGDRPVPAARCAALVAATNNEVMRWDLRPKDWHVIWPELIGTEGAPAVEASASPEAQG